MIGIVHQDQFADGLPRFGLPAGAASRLRAALLAHAEVILRIALLAGAFVWYALSQVAA